MKNKIIRLVFVVAPIIGLMGCSCSGQKRWPKETVLDSGMELTVTNRSGVIKIAYVSPLRRRYAWNDFARVLKMSSRKERWYGVLGIYSREAWPFSFSKRGGVSRIVAQEATLHFRSIKEFLMWRNEEWNRDRINIVYNNSGLAAGWCISPSRQQLNADVWRILINGKIPKVLPGATDSEIMLSPYNKNGASLN